MNNTATLGSLLFVTLFGCSSGGAGPASKTDSPLTDCAGVYYCKAESFASNSELHRAADGTCMFDGYVLLADGQVMLADATNGSWAGGAMEFSICRADDCRTCTALAREPTKPGTRCTGSPDSCSSRSPGSCATIRGCYMASHVRYNGSFSNSCEGSPASCDSIGSAESCAEQGCDWE
jgi:hypothetical protein